MLVPVGTALVVIGRESGEDVHLDVPPRAIARPRLRRAAPPEAARAQATPGVRRLAEELGRRPRDARRSGAGRPDHRGRRRAARRRGRRARARPAQRLLAGARGRSPSTSTRAHREVPAVTVVEECDFTGARGGRAAGRSLLPFLIAAVVSGLRAVPELNATFVGGEVGALGALRHRRSPCRPSGACWCRSCAAPTTLDRRRARRRARAGSPTARGPGRSRPGELRGSTFTVTSAGKLGGLFATPLVNHPEVGILGLHRIAERPVVRDGADRRAPDRARLVHVRPPGRRRRAGGGVPAARRRTARAL